MTAVLYQRASFLVSHDVVSIMNNLSLLKMTVFWFRDAGKVQLLSIACIKFMLTSPRHLYVALLSRSQKLRDLKSLPGV